MQQKIGKQLANTSALWAGRAVKQREEKILELEKKRITLCEKFFRRAHSYWR